MTPIRPRRSALYMPGSNARALEKAKSLDTDVLLLDLEDSVAPDAKEAARGRVWEAVHAGGFGHREVVVRINGLDTPWAEEDLKAAAACRPAAVLVPKVSAPEDLGRVGARLDALGAPHGTRIWAMIETPAAILHVAQIAAAARDPLNRLACFVMGTNDLAKDTRARLLPGRAAMLPWLMQALAAARAEGLDILDGVFNGLDDADGFEAECAQGRDMGFDGKTLIHPRQLEPANRLFAPDADEVARARAIIAAFEAPENAGRGAIALDGRMVERLHAEMARRTVALADAIAARG
ncbi:HpcH/HpaI aldolase/citrate lyase family protein [Salinarimonas chemoclinalis]|uniref:HpcH/HpaI aldolase/citrate lyase family protein n=1 Tax=Salinarimonas chemoclinalis TaxID=3241599 RepID=UPI0035576D4E